MYKKFINVSSLIFILATMCSLALPIFYTYIADPVAGSHMTIQIYNVAEFSSWGCMIIFLPLILLGIIFGKFNDTVKMFLIMATFLLCMASCYNAAVATLDWVHKQANGDVHSYGTMIVYAALFFISSLLSYMRCYLNQRNNTNI